MPDRANPVLVEVTRGAMIESRHRGAIAVIDAKGGVIERLGDIGNPVYARSAIKSLQAIPLVESGAAEHFRLGDRELALACASHGGEPRHVKAVAAWLDKIGLDHQALECGCHPPLHAASAEKMIRERGKPTEVHNNCSGKHTGFLTTAVHLGENPRGYIRSGHPVQRRVLTVLEEMCGGDLRAAPKGIDGCGIPVIGMSLQQMGRAMARMADPAGLPAPRRTAIGRIRQAIANQPYYVAGTGRFCTRVIAALGGKVLLKTGAEGVFTGMVPGRGWGIALKIDDGATRAAETAMINLLLRLKLLSTSQRKALADLIEVPLANRAGKRVGVVRSPRSLAR